MTEFIEGVQIPRKCEDCPQLCSLKALVGQNKQAVATSLRMAQMFFDTRDDTSAGIIATIAGALGEETATEIDISSGIDEVGIELANSWEFAEESLKASIDNLRTLVSNCAGSLLLRAVTTQGPVEVRICRSHALRDQRHQQSHVEWDSPTG